MVMRDFKYLAHRSGARFPWRCATTVLLLFVFALGLEQAITTDATTQQHKEASK